MKFNLKNTILAFSAMFLCVLIGLRHPVVAGLLLTLFSLAVNSPRARACVVTLSVPEILMDVLDAFKLELPEVFAPGGFSTDFSSKTAVLGDRITAHIAQVPVTASYNPVPLPGNTNPGFYNGAQDVTTLLVDVPVILNQFRHVPIKVAWLTQLSSKKPLYKEAVRNIGYALAKYVLDQTLLQVSPNISNTVTIPVGNVSLDTIEAIRSQLNLQKAAATGRFMISNTPFAAALQNDDRVKSSLFYGYLNGDRGYRLFKNLSGFGWIREYPDFPNAQNGLAFGGDPRSVVIATRRPDFSNVAADLGVPQIMEFYPMEDSETGLYMTGVAWQEIGTGDVYVSAAILFGISVGNQGTAAGSITDNAGVFIKSS